jgi:hypothetical protein
LKKKATKCVANLTQICAAKAIGDAKDAQVIDSKEGAKSSWQRRLPRNRKSDSRAAAPQVALLYEGKYITIYDFVKEKMRKSEEVRIFSSGGESYRSAIRLPRPEQATITFPAEG